MITVLDSLPVPPDAIRPLMPFIDKLYCKKISVSYETEIFIMRFIYLPVNRFAIPLKRVFVMFFTELKILVMVMDTSLVLAMR